MVLVTCLFLFMKQVFFKPVVQVMDDREAAIQSGSARRAEAAALVEARQADYAARLRELRGKAFEHRKALAAAAVRQKEALLEAGPRGIPGPARRRPGAAGRRPGGGQGRADDPGGSPVRIHGQASPQAGMT